MTNRPTIRALVFDAYGTLFDPLSVGALCEELYPGRGAALARSWRQKQLEYTWLRTLMERYEDFEAVTRDALHWSCAQLGLDCPDRHAMQLMEAYHRLAPYPEVREGLERLAGRPRAILSNGSPSMLAAVVQASGLDALLDAVISVDGIRRFKPAPSVYALATEKLGVAAHEVAFVSSNHWDVSGAAAFGFRTYWINRTGAVPDRLGQSPVAVLTSLTELSDHLDGP